MRRRRSNKGDFEISEIGIGTYSLSGVYGRADVDSVREMLKRAFELGITFFDTGPGYGDAEKILGEVVGEFRDDIFISTKVAGGMAGEPLAYKSIMASCHQSLKNLGVDYIDLYAAHFDDGKTPVEEVIRAFEDLKSAGKIRFYGLGHVFAERAPMFLNKGDFSTVMGELSAVSDRYYTRMLPLMRTSRADYLGFSVTGRGLLTGSVKGRFGLEKGDIRNVDALFAGERLKSGLRIAEKMAEIAGEIGASRAQVAIRWALNRENVICAICGPSSVKHIEENAGASSLCGDTDSFKTLDKFVEEESASLAEKLCAEIEAILSSPFLGTDDIPRLVYAAESMGELGMVPDERLIPVFKRLLGLMNDESCEDGAVNQVKEAMAGLLHDGGAGHRHA